MKGEVSYFMSTRNSPYRLDMLVLSTLSKHDCYGYQLTQIFDECSNGIIKPKVSSLYPILYRLIDQGYISSYEEIIKTIDVEYIIIWNQRIRAFTTIN